MDRSESWSSDWVLGGRRCKVHTFRPEPTNKTLHSTAEKDLTRVTLLLERSDDVGYFVVPVAVLEELADSLGPRSLGFVHISFGKGCAYVIRLSALLPGLDERRWKLSPLSSADINCAGYWGLVGYLPQPDAILGPRAKRKHAAEPSFVFLDLDGGGAVPEILEAMQCPFDNSDIRNHFSACPVIDKLAPPNPKLSGVKYSADDAGNVYAAFVTAADEPVLNIAKRHLDVLAAFPARQRHIRVIAPKMSIDVTMPFDEIALPRLSAKATKQPFYSVRLPLQRCLALPQYTQLSLPLHTQP